MSYEDEEQMIIDDESLSEKERKKALSALYWEGVEYAQEYPEEQY